MRLFFHLVNDDRIIYDDVGVEAAGPYEAYLQIHAALAEMRRENEVPEDLSGWRLDVTDETGQVVLSVTDLDAG